MSFELFFKFIYKEIPSMWHKCNKSQCYIFDNFRNIRWNNVHSLRGIVFDWHLQHFSDFHLTISAFTQSSGDHKFKSSGGHESIIGPALLSGWEEQHSFLHCWQLIKAYLQVSLPFTLTLCEFKKIHWFHGRKHMLVFALALLSHVGGCHVVGFN